MDSEPSEIEISVDGTVRAQLTGDPVGGVEIGVFSPEEDGALATTTSDEDGSYILSFEIVDTEASNELRIEAETDDFDHERTIDFSENLTHDIELGPFAGGLGSEENPYEIATATGLQAIGVEEELDHHFRLIDDVDATETQDWNGGQGFLPIGGFERDNREGPFTGTFDGNGHKITDLAVNRPSERMVGLFGFTDGAYIEDLNLREVDIQGGEFVAGGLIGNAAGSESETRVQGVLVTGTVQGEFEAGGLVGGLRDSEIESSRAEVRVSIGSSVQGAGGLVGFTSGSASVRDAEATGDVSGRSSIGGLVGTNSGSLQESRATGNVEGGSGLGGLVGSNFGEIHDSNAEGQVSARVDAGGLVGSNSGLVERSYATGTVNVTGGTAGGLVGHLSDGSVRMSFAEGDVEGEEGAPNEGGLVGRSSNDTEIEASYALGDVQGEEEVGGLVGQAVGTNVRESYATGEVVGDSAVGGFVGLNSGSTLSGVWDRKATGLGRGVGENEGDASNEIIGLATDEMQGESAPDNMDGFDFEETWQVVSGDYPALQWEE